MPNSHFEIETTIPTSISGVIIAFDFGTKKMGMAVGQTLTGTATPLPAIAAREGVPDWNALAKLIARWRPCALVVGIPIDMYEVEQPVTLAARNFAHQLKDRFKLPVYGVDERLTTRTARQQLFEQGGYKLIKKQSIDSVAAQLILESWLRQWALQQS